MPTTTPPQRLAAKVLRDMLAQHTFTNTTEVAEALTTQLKRLDVPSSSATVTRALELVGSNRALVRRTPSPCGRLPEQPVPAFTTADIKALFATCGFEIEAGR